MDASRRLPGAGSVRVSSLEGPFGVFERVALGGCYGRDYEGRYSGFVERGAQEDILHLFDEDPDRVRRYLTRLSYTPDDPVRDRAIEVVRLLSRERSRSMPEFFHETIRRHIWAMNEEGGNIDWSAPEIIGAVIAGNPEMFGKFFSFAFIAAVDELTFQPSLVRAYDLVREAAPEVVEGYARRIEELRGCSLY